MLQVWCCSQWAQCCIKVSSLQAFSVKHLPALPSPRKAQPIFPNTFVSTIMHVLYAYTNSHIWRDTEEEILEGKKKQFAAQWDPLLQKCLPSHCCHWKMVSSGTGLSLPHLLSINTEVQHNLSGNIPLFRLQKNNPDSGRNPPALYHCKQIKSQVISLSITTSQLLQAAKTPWKLPCCWWHNSTWYLAYQTYFGAFP